MVPAHWNEDFVNINNIYHIPYFPEPFSAIHNVKTCLSALVDPTIVEIEAVEDKAVFLSALSGTRSRHHLCVPDR